MIRISNNLSIMERDEWDVSDASRRGVSVAPGRRELLILHHTVTLDDDETKNVWETLGEIKNHMVRLRTIRESDLGADVPYNWCLFLMPEGRLVAAEGRGNRMSGAHTFPYRGVRYNTLGIGAAFVGNFRDYGPILNLWLPAINRFYGWLMFDNGMSNMKEVVYHGALPDAQTACPGTNVINMMPFIRPEWSDEEVAGELEAHEKEEEAYRKVTAWFAHAQANAISRHPLPNWLHEKLTGLLAYSKAIGEK